jgi:flavocytochrome c
MSQVIVLGGGLSGLSAAHTALQQGQNVVLIDKCAFMGGNSTKATSGINGAGTRVQDAMGIPDSKEKFEDDTIRGGTGVKKGPCPEGWPLAETLAHKSADAIHWLIDQFGLELDTVSRLGGHSFRRTHRKKSGGKFPGFMITYKLMQIYEQICEQEPNRARFINKGRANKLLQDASGRVIGVEYVKNGQTLTEMGCVVIATGGYAAGGLEPDSLLSKVRPDLMHFPTTNGEHCTGDGIALAIGAGGFGNRLEDVQIHPTGLVNPAMPDSRVLFLGAGALRGEGGIILDNEGRRFCDDLGPRNYVTGRMLEHNKAPYRLVLNETAVKGIDWHVHHYKGRGVMKGFNNAQELADEIGCPVSNLEETFAQYNRSAETKQDPWDKKFFPATPFLTSQSFAVGIVTPVAHYTVGGVGINVNAEAIKESGEVIPGLFVAGEAAGGVHGNNRLGGSALLECVVFGRLAGASAARHNNSLPAPASTGAAVTISIPQTNGTTITVTINGNGVVSSGAPPPVAAAPAAAPAEEKKQEMGSYTMTEVAKHKTEDDCWVAINGQVLDVTNFLADHPR